MSKPKVYDNNKTLKPQQVLLKVGTRKSKLALIQAQLVVDKIIGSFPDLKCKIIPILTTGEQILDKNLYDIGGKALFLKELETALVNGQIDIAVHSMKDVPGRLPDSLELAAVLEREDPYEVFVSSNYTSISDLPKGAILGSSSVRRKVLIKKQRPDLNIVMFRGNVDTRLNKVMNNEVDGTILAAAGLKRLGLFNSRYCFPISFKEMLPSLGQGVIVVEINSNNNFARSICQRINHNSTWKLMQLERAFVEYLNADCQTPLSAHAWYIDDYNIEAHFMLADNNGKSVLFYTSFGNINDARNMGLEAAKKLSQTLNLVQRNKGTGENI